MRMKEKLQMYSNRTAWKREGFLMALTARVARLGIALLLLFALALAAAPQAQAATKFCSEFSYNGVQGVIDGSMGTAPVQVTIDMSCTFQNWPQSNPLTTNINFQTNDPSIYLIIFDNVWFDGHLACSNIDHKLWVVNSPMENFDGSCQDLMVPTESIYKKSPAATAAIGEPFTYTLTYPAMTSPYPDQVGGPSPNDLGTVTIWDSLNAIKLATGVDLTFVSIKAYWKGSGILVPLVQETDPLAKGGVWTTKNLSYKSIPMITAGQQLIVEITVVLDNTPTNVAGKTFTNIAKWWFSRWIDLNEDGIEQANEFFNPLPGQSGTAQTMIIGEPYLMVDKFGLDASPERGGPCDLYHRRPEHQEQPCLERRHQRCLERHDPGQAPPRHVLQRPHRHGRGQDHRGRRHHPSQDIDCWRRLHDHL